MAALIILAAVRIRASLKNTFAVVLAALSFFLVACFTNIDMIYAILAGGLLGVLAGKIAVGGHAAVIYLTLIWVFFRLGFLP